MTTPTDPAPLAVSSRDAARMLAISPRTLWQVTSPRGDLPYFRVGKRAIRYSVRDLEAWINGQKQKGGNP